MEKQMGKRSKSAWGWFFFVIAILMMTGVEFCYFLSDGSTLKRFAGLTWIVVSVGFLLSVTLNSFKPFFRDSFWRDKDRFWYLTAFILPICLIYFDVSGITWTPINDEGTQQVSQGLTLLQQDPDFGIYRLTYFVGYIARQYVLAALPTYFFGPSLLALRLGTSIIYLCGYLTFLSALAHYLEKRKASHPLLLASFAGIMVSLGEYPLIQARVFEQTTMPIGAMLLFLAGIFNFLSRPTAFGTFWVAWSFGFFVEGYTPALGGWCLAFFVMLYLALHPKHKQRVLWLPLVYGVCCLAIAYLLMSSGHALKPRFETGLPGFTVGDWVWRYFMGYHAWLGAGFSVIPCPLALAALAACYFSLKYRDYRFPLLCMWCVAMAFASLTCVGSNFNLPQFDIHRSMFILPPLAAGVVLFYQAYRPTEDSLPGLHRAILTSACFAMLYMVCTGAAIPFAVRTYIYEREMTDYDEALYKIDCLNFNSRPQKITKIYILPPLKIDDLETGLVYFAPSAMVVRGNPPVGEKEPGAYLLSYLSKNEEDRAYDVIVPSRHPRPYLQLKQE
jgi:hypothetical protein